MPLRTVSAPTSQADPGLGSRIPLYPSQFLIAMAIVSLGPLLDSMMTDLGIPLSRGGLISTGLYLGNVSSVVIMNAALAHISVKRIIVSANALQSIALIVAGLVSWNLASLFIAYVAVGFGGGLMNTVCWVWISAHMRHDRAGAALRMILFFALAMISIPLLLGLILDAGGSWRWILVTEGCLSFLAAIAASLLPLLEVRERRNIHPSHLREVIAFDPKLLLGIMVAGMTYVGAEMSLNIWLPKVQLDLFAASETWAGLSVTFFWVGLTVGRMVVSRLTRLAPAALLLLGCALVLTVFSAALAIAPSQVVSLVLVVGAGLGASASYGLIGSYAGRFPGWQSPVATSLFVLSGGVGSITFPYLMGPLASAAGFRVALGVVPVLSLACGVAALLIHAQASDDRD